MTRIFCLEAIIYVGHTLHKIMSANNEDIVLNMNADVSKTDKIDVSLTWKKCPTNVDDKIAQREAAIFS